MADEAVIWNAVSGMVGVVVGAVAGWAGKRVEKAPDIQTTLTAAIADVVKHYKDALDRADGTNSALREEIAELRRLVEAQSDKIEEQSTEIAGLVEHVVNLEASIRDLGGKPPPRRRRPTAPAEGEVV